MSSTRKIGILGGTFDPIHSAHLVLGEKAYRQFGLDKVWFMPSKQPPHKTAQSVSPVKDRLAMVRLAIADTPYFECSEFELGLPGKSYTANTLAALCQLYPNLKYYFILGGDSLFALEQWYRTETILRHAVLLAAVREDHDRKQMREQIAYLTGRYGGSIELLYTPMMDVSSSEIRRLIGEGQPVSELLPEAVERYIREHRLYMGERGAQGRGTETHSPQGRSAGRDMRKCNTEEHTVVEAELADELPETIVCEVAARLKETLKPQRYEHTLNVAAMARHLAVVVGADPERAYLAGLLHDCAKSYSDEELLKLCGERHIPISESEKKIPQLLHAKYGAWMAEHEYGIKDKIICSAIACHTTGKPGMTTLDKVVFAADYLEPGRNKAPHLNILRKLAEKDLDLTVLRILQDTLEFLQDRGAAIDPVTGETYRWMAESLPKKGEHHE